MPQVSAVFFFFKEAQNVLRPFFVLEALSVPGIVSIKPERCSELL